MQASKLLKPGVLSTSERLRREVANAISQVEVAKAHGAPGGGAQLGAFLADAASKTPDYAGGVLPATEVVVKHGDTVGVKNSAGDVTVNGTLSVSGGVLRGVALPATQALVASGALSVAATGSGTHVTITVAGGKITAVTLSDTI